MLATALLFVAAAFSFFGRQPSLLFLIVAFMLSLLGTANLLNRAGMLRGAGRVFLHATDVGI
jgi:adhesin HecA-like repeat protein